ncbi:hypothetical protein [Nocardia goodfellowii]|uniref:Uncharacterized protein n=1 Tax=Nocardia goodfellowii TaxID=882446 RepID=A0ABS4QEP9_9NOCA|nr:hypothetical protein [Nocardia goodfellowii]MBP2190173.1 hypothetical protein [Nocardia goodfellowii]
MRQTASEASTLDAAPNQSTVALIGEPQGMRDGGDRFTVNDATLVVLERFRLAAEVSAAD